MNRATHIAPRFGIKLPDPLPVAAMMRGRTPDDVAALLPRLFNLCRHAQAAAAQLVFGLGEPDRAELAREIAREHILRLTVFVPRGLGFVPCAVGPDASADRLFGGAFPETPEEFEEFLRREEGLGPVFAALRDRFVPGQACVQVMPSAAPTSLFEPVAQENSAAARQAAHAVMRYIENEYGRGQLWRMMGRAIDLRAALAGDIPLPRVIAPGMAVVPSARGLYGLKVQVDGGLVMGLQRITPTDHLLAPGGAMAQTLASLGDASRETAELVLTVLDPCVPLKLEETTHA